MGKGSRDDNNKDSGQHDAWHCAKPLTGLISILPDTGLQRWSGIF